MEDGRITLVVPWYCLKGTKIANENNRIITALLHVKLCMFYLNIIYSVWYRFS